jgi:hypothetical protein
MEIFEQPTFTVDGKTFGSRPEAEAYVRLQALREKAEQFALEHLSADEHQPAVRSITRTVNVICAWEEWLQAQRDAEKADD